MTSPQFYRGILYGNERIDMPVEMKLARIIISEINENQVVFLREEKVHWNRRWRRIWVQNPNINRSLINHLKRKLTKSKFSLFSVIAFM